MRFAPSRTGSRLSWPGLTRISGAGPVCPFVPGALERKTLGSAIYNPSFRPFTPPVPFLLMRHAVISDWKFFLDNEEWLTLWARRHREFAVQALAEELRRLPWRARRD
jgi:hypothetical protein